MCLRGWRTTSLFYPGSKCLILPDGLKKLTSLEVLESVNVESESMAAELGHLTQLRVLEVTTKAPGKAVMESLGKLTKLETLYIHSIVGRRVDLNFSLEEPLLLGSLRWLHLRAITLVPTWFRPASLPGLSYLHLEVEREQREDIQVLGTLPCLTYLYFREIIRSREALERCVVGPNAFPRLVKCEFYIEGGGVVPRTFQGGAMPRLQEFAFRIKEEEFRNRRRGPTVDDMVLSHLPSLRTVTVRGDACYYSERNDRTKKLREKLEHEAAVHPNHPSIHFKKY
jgi:disease resistance protein RPM1